MLRNACAGSPADISCYIVRLLLGHTMTFPASPRLEKGRERRAGEDGWGGEGVGGGGGGGGSIQ